MVRASVVDRYDLKGLACSLQEFLYPGDGVRGIFLFVVHGDDDADLDRVIFHHRLDRGLPEHGMIITKKREVV
mgnify:CR=1 FL=1